MIRLLLRARMLPQRVADAVRGRGAKARDASWPATFRVRDLGALGWIKLGERPGAELVFGAVSKPWQPVASGSGEPVTAGQFAGFGEPAFAKIAESTSVDPYGERFSIVTVESRVALTDEDSRRRFRRCWLMMGPFMKLMRPTIMHALGRQLQLPSPWAGDASARTISGSRSRRPSGVRHRLRPGLAPVRRRALMQVSVSGGGSGGLHTSPQPSPM